MQKNWNQELVERERASQEAFVLRDEAKVRDTGQRGVLAKYFPSIRSRKEVLDDIRAKPALCEQFLGWEPGVQEDFLDCCTGVKGMKMLYDGIFKEIL